jgi:hypothetical protein
MTFNPARLRWLTALFLMFFCARACSQALPAEQLRSASAASLDRHLAAGSRISDSLKIALKQTLANLTARNFSLRDSLLLAGADTLRHAGKDSVTHVCGSMAGALSLLNARTMCSLDSAHAHHSALLRQVTEQFIPSLKEAEEGDDPIQALNETLATLADSLSTTQIDRTSLAIDVLVETSDTYRDSLTELTRTLIDETPVTSIVLSFGYNSLVAYQGRDNGVSQYAVMPSLGYHHASGLFVSGSASLVSQPTGQWDNGSLSLGYERDLSACLSIQTSYTHYWYRKDSEEASSNINNSVMGDAALFLAGILLDVNGNLDFGSSSEISLGMAIGYRISCGSLFSRIPATVEPRFSAFYGQQDGAEIIITQTNIAKNKPAVVTTTTTARKIFGIMDYQIGLPLKLSLGRESITPQFIYDIPLNVIDGSSTAPFGSFSVEMSMTW